MFLSIKMIPTPIIIIKPPKKVEIFGLSPRKNIAANTPTIGRSNITGRTVFTSYRPKS